MIVKKRLRQPKIRKPVPTKPNKIITPDIIYRRHKAKNEWKKQVKEKTGE